MTWYLPVPSTWARRALYACCLLGLAAGIYGAFRVVRGCQLTAVLSGSMAPAVRAGSIVLTCARPGAAYRTGDIALFPSPQDPSILVLHRLSRVYENLGGAAVVSTRGDANAGEDDWQVARGSIRGRSVGTFPYAGFLAWKIRSRIGFAIVVLVTFWIFVVAELRLLAHKGQLIRLNDSYETDG